jgi:MFS family permease
MTDLPTAEPEPGEVPDARSGTTRTAAPPTSKPLRGGLFRHHDFRQLFIGDAISQVGTQLTVLALPVLAIQVLGADEFEMGLLGTFEFLAFLVIGLPAGAWVDRWRKKRVLVSADVARAFALGSLPLAWAFDVLTLVQMFVVALVVGVSTVFFDVAYQSYLPELVPSEKISEGNAKLQGLQSVAQVAGPATGGFLIRAIGAPLTIALDAVSFLGSALFVSRIRHADEPPPKAGRRPLVEEVKEGLLFVWHQPLLLRIAACTSIGNLFNSMASVLLVLFALRELGLRESDLGIVFALGSVGGLLGALVTTRITRWVGEGRTIPLSALLFAPFTALVPLAGDPIPPMVALSLSMFGFSFAVLVYNITQVSFRQRLCPKPLLGRMNASIRFVVWGTMPIGSFIGGVLGTQVGIRGVYWIAVAGALVSALPVLFSPLIRMRDLPRELDQHAEPAA